MKKILIVGLTVLSLSISAFGAAASWDNGVSRNSLNKGPLVDGYYGALDIMTDDKRTPVSIGLGFDVNGFVTDKSGSGAGSGAYTMGITGKLGLNFEPLMSLPLVVQAGAGYGLFDIGVHTHTGPQYEASADIGLYRNLGIGAKYKLVPDIDFSGTKVDLESTIFYLNIRL